MYDKGGNMKYKQKEKKQSAPTPLNTIYIKYHRVYGRYRIDMYNRLLSFNRYK